MCGTHADGWFWCLAYDLEEECVAEGAAAAAALPLLRLSVVEVVLVVVAVAVVVVVVVVLVVAALSPVTTSSFLAFFRVAIVACKEVSGMIASTSDITASTTGLVLLAELEVYVGGLSSRAVPADRATFSDPFSFSAGAGAGAGAVFLRPRPPFTENSNSGAAFEVTVALLIWFARFDAAVVVGTVISLGCCGCLLAAATSTAVGLTSEEEEEEDALTYTPSAFLLLVASAVEIGPTRPFLLFKEGGSSASSNSFCFSMR